MKPWLTIYLFITWIGWSSFLPAQTTANREWNCSGTINAAVEAYDGRVAMAGANGGRLYFALFDPQSEEILELDKVEWTGISGEARALIRTFDGCFILAGNTSDGHINHPGIQTLGSPSAGKNGLIIKIDPKGYIVWGWLINGQNVELADLVQLPDGNIITVGEKEGNLIGIKFNKFGDLAWPEIKTFVPSARANGIALHPNGSLAVTGSKGDKGDRRALFLLLDKEGNAKLQTLTNQMFAEGTAITVDYQRGGFAIAGQTVSSVRTEEDVFLAIFSESGKPAWDTLLSKKNSDIVTSLIQLPDGQFVLGGKSKSYASYTNRYKGWIFSHDRPVKDRYPNENGKFEDGFNDLLMLQNGELLAFGYMNTATNRSKGWIYRIEQTYLPGGEAGMPPLIAELDFISNDRNDTLNIEENGYVRFSLDNIGKQNFWDVKAITYLRRPAWTASDHVETMDTFFLGRVPRLQGRVGLSIPLYGERQQATGSMLVQVNLVDYRGRQIAAFSYTVATKSEPMPKLVIVRSEWIKPKPLPERRKDTISLEISIRNVGEADAYIISRFLYPAKIDLLDESESYQEDWVHPLKPNESRKIKLTFLVRSYYEKDSIEIGFMAWGRKVADKKWPVVTRIDTVKTTKIENFYLIKRANREPFIPEWARPGSKGGPGPDDDFCEPKIVCQVVAPVPLELGRVFSDDIFVHFKIEITTPFNEQLLLSDIELYYDHELVPTRRQNGKKHPQLVGENSGNQYTFFHVIRLQTDKGELSRKLVELKVKGEVLWFSYLKFDPKINLHLLSIGIPYSNLQQTANGATAIADVFKQQINGNLFENVFIEKLTTTQDFVDNNSLMNQLYNHITGKFGDKNVQSWDYIIIYISSHASLEDGDFLYLNLNDKGIQRSDKYDLTSELRKMNKKNFNKALFLDMCFSGAVIPDPENNPPIDSIYQRMDSIIRKSNSLTIFAACLEQGRAKLDSVYGLFTRTVLEALSDETVEVEDKEGNIRLIKADDGDKDLTVGEIYEFVRLRGAYLITQRFGHSFEQSPLITVEPQNRDLPVLSF